MPRTVSISAPRSERMREVRTRYAVSMLAAGMLLALGTGTAVAQDLPPYLRDRGAGVATSMFGTYVEPGQLLVYPFVEWYFDSNMEYKPSEFGFGLDRDLRGRFRASEQLLFLGYGITRNLAIEVEAAHISAKLEKAPDDPTAMPAEFKESGLGDVEGQLRWRWLEENEDRPEAFAYFEATLPLQKDRRLIGTQDWEFKLGVGLTRGYAFGTMTLRAAVESIEDEGKRKLEAGEYAIEYLRRLSPKWRVVGVLEGNQVDELELITEAQWRFHRRAFLKVNNGFGLTENATDYAPEVGVMLSF